MIHLYIAGSLLQEVTLEFADGRIGAGAWYRCPCVHRLPDKYSDGKVIVYHRSAEPRKA